MNQYCSAIFYLLVTMSSRSLGAPLDGPIDGCVGGLANGALLERGRFIYECRNGAIVPKGCVSDELKRIVIGSTVDKKYHRLQCVLGDDNLLSFQPVSCLHQGTEHKIGEQWDDGNNFYICKKLDSGDVRGINIGCIDQNVHVPLNEKITKENFVLVCNATVNNGARLMHSACVKDGREFAVGETFESDKAWYICTRTGSEKLSAKLTGCVNGGKRLNDGDRILDNGVFYECTVESGKAGVRATGCQQTDGGSTIERKLGCTWVTGTAPLQYEVQCVHDPSTNSAKVVPVRCNYNVGSGVYNIEVGCYRVVEKAAFGCLQDGSNLKLQSFQGDNFEQAASGAGLRAC